MEKYMINIYTGWSVYDPLIMSEVLFFPTEQDATEYAEAQIENTTHGFSVNRVR